MVERIIRSKHVLYYALQSDVSFSRLIRIFKVLIRAQVQERSQPSPNVLLPYTTHLQHVLGVLILVHVGILLADHYRYYGSGWITCRSFCHHS